MKETAQPEEKNWEEILQQKLPYLGHRNWIVIADMAYPLQSSEGIITLWANESYESVLGKVNAMINEAPHVFAHVYYDKELSFIPEEDAPGITALRRQMEVICGKEAQSIPHEELISRLDEAGKLFSVVLIKTPTLIPYTTTFFELDCNYWDATRASRLEERMNQQ
ncbi:MAG: hypothetical protein J6T94_06460 [Bacteroidaceae bacterium]|nr:hypothetical protein [Bacteroidaceae bacterium]